MNVTEPAPQTISILGSTVYYWTFHPGSDKTVVALHGFRGTHHGLQKIIDALPDYTIIVPDLPGFGRSTPMTDRPHDIAGYGEFAWQFIQAVASASPLVLGHSFGTIIAAQLAAAHPGLIHQLILINPIVTKDSAAFKPAISVGRFYYWLGGRVLPERAGMALLKSTSMILLGSIIMAKTKDKALRRAIHQSHIDHFGDFQSRRVLNESYDASISHGILDYASAITMPTLLIAGEVDDIAPAKGQYVLEKQLPDARLIMIPGVGHLIHHEAAHEAAAAIRDFLG